MNSFGKLLRTVSLAILFGGSAATVLGAVVLIHAAKAKGIPVHEAAATNAPLFITFSKVNLVCGILLLIGEGLDYAARKIWSKLTIAQYACSLLCVCTAMVFALGIVPAMEQALPSLSNPTIAEEFQRLHKISQPLFGSTILLAFLALILPIFGALNTTNSSRAESA